MTTTAAPAIAWKITGKGPGGQCGHCPRRLAVHYVITDTATGRAMTVGRGCLKKITGWTVTAAQADAAVRLAAREARWAAWCAANPAEARVITAAAEREAGEFRQGLRQCGGYAQSVRTCVGDGAPGWEDYLGEYLGRCAAAVGAR
jgi:hypothetical protein